jgi:hypothetical protein
MCSRVISRMAESHRAIAGTVVLFENVFDDVVVVDDVHFIGRSAEQFAEFAFRRVLDAYLVGNAAKERLIDELAGLEVRREDDKLIEGDLNLPAAGQVEEVVSFLQRHDPAVEQLVGADALAAVPQLLLSCSGASLMPVALLMVTSRLAIVSSPPTTMVGLRMRIQRSSTWRPPIGAGRPGDGIASWLLGS